MKLADALEAHRLPWPRNNKIACPACGSHQTPALHLYERDNSFYCFSCARSGDGYGLAALLEGVPVSVVLRRSGGGAPTSTVEQPWQLQERQVGEFWKVVRPLFKRILAKPGIDTEWMTNAWALEVEDALDLHRVLPGRTGRAALESVAKRMKEVVDYEPALQETGILPALP